MMKPRTRFLWGGVGALIPILISVAVSDIDRILTYLDGNSLKLAGYAARALALFAVGGIWVVAQASIQDIGKALQLGIAAPAAITVWISGANVDMERHKGGTERNVATLSIISSAYAQTGPGQPPKSPVQTFIDGFLGR